MTDNKPKLVASPLQEKILSLRLSLKAPQSALLMWERLLSAEDRAFLGGDRDVSYKSLGTVGMWMTLRGGSELRAAIDLGKELEYITPATYKWLLREIGESEATSVRVLPSWNRDTGELSFGGRVVRRIANRNRATNIVAILNTFQEERWPDMIYDPLPTGPDSQRLREAVRTLNKGIEAIRFSADGSGTGIVWKPADTRATPAPRP